MYEVIIEFKHDIAEEILQELTEVIAAAFDNIGGCIRNSHTASPYRFEFSGDEDGFECLQLGLLILEDNKLFWDNVDIWKWIDHDDDSESCDVKEEFSKVVW